MLASWITIPVNSSSPMESYLSLPEQLGIYPAIILLMEIFGVNHHIRNVADRLAHEGYVVLAPNYYHRTTPNLELGYTEADMLIGRQHKEQTTAEGLLEDIQTCMGYLRLHPLVNKQASFGSMGFCFGGHVAYLAATLPEIKATASFYGAGIAVTSPGGGLPTLNKTAQIQGQILCLFGGKDPLIALEQVLQVEQALQQNKISAEVVCYPETGHGFFCNERADYNPQAAQDAWQKVIALFKSQLHD